MRPLDCRQHGQLLRASVLGEGRGESGLGQIDQPVLVRRQLRRLRMGRGAVEHIRDGFALVRGPDDYLLRWELARALARSRRHRDSAAHLRAVIALKPQWAWVENHLGAALCLAGGADEISEGIAHFRRGVTLEPGNPIIRYNLAMALARGGRPDLARSECERAILDAAICHSFVAPHCSPCLGWALNV